MQEIPTTFIKKHIIYIYTVIIELMFVCVMFVCPLSLFEFITKDN